MEKHIFLNYSFRNDLENSYTIINNQMSQSLAAAKKRRAAPGSANDMPPPVQSRQQPSQNASSGLTLPQVIAVIDTRLIKLENFMNESVSSPTTSNTVNNNVQSIDETILEEYNNRFEILAEEISNLKDIMLKLQSFTMEVNKTLMEERINVFSELGNSMKSNDVSENVDFASNATDKLSSVNLRNLVKEEFNNKLDS